MLHEQDAQPWAVRAARNQALFRAINDELKTQGGSGSTGALTIACECADVECVGTLEIDFDRYEQVRREATRFIVLRGHVYSDIEHVVAEDGGFVVVEKTGEAGRVAVASDGS
jgi:formiminotetrahydrofolate cyclodeaminase